MAGNAYVQPIVARYLDLQMLFLVILWLNSYGADDILSHNSALVAQHNALTLSRLPKVVWFGHLEDKKRETGVKKIFYNLMSPVVVTKDKEAN